MSLLPLRLSACYMERLWGGGRLKREYGKTDAPDRTGESWELADHPDGQTTVADGSLAGRTLSELAAMDSRGFWGEECPSGRFPLLVKLIDAEKELSVQVHPSDETALKERREQGKAELWYILDAKPHAHIYLGFSRRVTPEEYRRRVEQGSILDLLNRIEVKRGDVFFIEPGTIHAIGGGTLLAEIQQNSNTTFRIHDFNRLGADGMPRALHWERAGQVLRYAPLVPSMCRANNVTVFPAFTMAELACCPHFRVYQLEVRTRAALRCDGLSFQHLLCIQGEGRLLAHGKTYTLCRGQSFFLPAAMGEYTLEGACRVLLTRL